ncbi:FliH/SctL family protein [Sphingomonas flavalba]|uniref:FliH/SctL family protein n=1 Tax=Sphingomonas flavalba TaxID=2559804 RepID=UPI0039E16743
MSDPRGGFLPGEGARTVDSGALGDYMAQMRAGFAAAGPGAPGTEGGPVHFSPAPAPRHFSPADPGHNPTAGWDPFDPMGERQAQTPAEAEAEAGAAPAGEEALRAAARAEGYAAGLVAAQQSSEHQVAAIEKLARAIAAIETFDREELAARLRQTVLFLVARLVGEIGVAPDLLAERVAAAADLLAESTEPALLRLHPDDLPLVEGRLPDRVFAIADKGVERGGLLIETKTTAIEDGPATWLAQLAAAIDRVALPETE